MTILTYVVGFIAVLSILSWIALVVGMFRCKKNDAVCLMLVATALTYLTPFVFCVSVVWLLLVFV